MKRFLPSVAGAFLLFALAACDNNSAKNDPAEKADSANEAKFDDTRMEEDAEWAAEIAQGGMVEHMLGKYAVTNAASPAVKELGQTLVTDHEKMNEELSAVAKQKNISLPTALSPEMQKRHDDVISKTGADFDKAFLDEVIKDHEMMIESFREQANDGKDADLKAWASQKLPALEAHLAKAKSVRDSMK